MPDLADMILAARREKRVLEPLGTAAPASPAAGYALQRQVAERLGAVPPAGFKIGATTQQMQAYLGLAGPAAGFVPAESLRPNGAILRFADFQNPGVECEVVLAPPRSLTFTTSGKLSRAAVKADYLSGAIRDVATPPVGTVRVELERLAVAS